MFSFLNTGILIAAVAALIPLIIHLFSRRRVRIIEFSSLKHLKAMQRRQVKRLKIRQLLLLLLRMLIIFVVVLAFARPTTSGDSIGSHASVSAVVLFDNSASMNRYVRDGLLFDLAKNRTLELLSNFGESDEIALITLGNSSERSDNVSFSSVAIAKELLQSVNQGYGATNLEAALEKARELLNKAQNLNKEVYIVSDQQRNALPDEMTGFSEGINLYFVDLPVEQIENVGIIEVDFGGRLLLPGKPFEITATVKNYGDENQNEIIASLSIDGNRVAQTNLRIDAEKENVVRFSHTLSRGGFHSGYIELSDDKFAGDNRFYFSFQIPDAFNILIIDGDPASELLKLALVPSDISGQYWSVKQSTPDDLLGVNFRDYDVIILSGAPTLSNTLVDRLKSYIRFGRSLLITYSAETDIDAFNRNWSEITGVHFDERLDKNFSGAGYYSLGYINNNHPVFSVFEFTDKKLPELRFFTLPKAHTIGNSSVIMRFSGDRPALVENQYFGGRVLTFTGPIAPLYTDITAHAFFVPFVARITEYLASRLSAYDASLYTGTNIVRSLSLKGSIDKAIELVTPDTETVYVPPQEGSGSVTYNPVNVDIPGIYRAYFNRQEIDRFAVNINPQECDLTFSSFDQIAKALGANEYHELENQQPLEATIAELRFGKELWQMFLWIAVFLILTEMLLSRSSPAENE